MGIITLKGQIQSGKGGGKRIGFPTINIAAPKSVKKEQWGVYFSLIKIRGKLYPAITQLGPSHLFGFRPTCESHLLAFSGNLCGKLATKKLFFKIRESQRFEMVRQLKKQLKKDIKAAKIFFGL